MSGEKAVKGRRATEAEVDIRVQNEGTIFLFFPVSESGKAWIAENIGTGEDRTYWGEALVVEHRYARGLAEGIVGDGLVVR